MTANSISSVVQLSLVKQVRATNKSCAAAFGWYKSPLQCILSMKKWQCLWHGSQMDGCVACDSRHISYSYSPATNQWWHLNNMDTNMPKMNPRSSVINTDVLKWNEYGVEWRAEVFYIGTATNMHWMTRYILDFQLEIKLTNNTVTCNSFQRNIRCHRVGTLQGYAQYKSTPRLQLSFWNWDKQQMKVRRLLIISGIYNCDFRFSCCCDLYTR